MKKVFLALCLTVGLAFSAWGHVPEGQVLLAYQFAAGSEPTLDGDLSEWAVVPADYWIGPELYTAPDGSQWTDLSDLNSKVIVGYSASTDRLYIHHEYFDDFRKRDFANLPPVEGIFGDEPNLPDTFEIQVDGDHGGEDSWYDPAAEPENGSRWAQNIHFRIPDLDPTVAERERGGDGVGLVLAEPGYLDRQPAVGDKRVYVGCRRAQRPRRQRPGRVDDHGVGQPAVG